MIGFGKRVFNAIDRRTGYVMSRLILKQQVRRAGAGRCRIIIGAGGKTLEEWIPTQIYTLNMVKQEDWERYFLKGSIDAMLAEHVWEHLAIEEGVEAARNCHTYLKSGGYLRAAVPDGLHPDPNYIEYVKPGGTGIGSEDHKVFYTHETFRRIFEDAGFKVHLLEYFDEKGEFHREDWDPEQGPIKRSERFDERNRDGRLKYSSIIIDAIKET